MSVRVVCVVYPCLSSNFSHQGVPDLSSVPLSPLDLRRLLTREDHSQNITPPFQPFACACATHCANVAPSIYPFEAAPESIGFPITILFSGTPAYELIPKTLVSGQELPESFKSESQSSYTPLPLTVSGSTRQRVRATTRTGCRIGYS